MNRLYSSVSQVNVGGFLSQTLSLQFSSIPFLKEKTSFPISVIFSNLPSTGSNSEQAFIKNFLVN